MPYVERAAHNAAFGAQVKRDSQESWPGVWPGVAWGLFRSAAGGLDADGVLQGCQAGQQILGPVGLGQPLSMVASGMGRATETVVA